MFGFEGGLPMHVIPYINLAGTAEEAIAFYQSVFGGSVEMTRWGDMPPDSKMPLTEEWHDKVMHGALTVDDKMTVYLADSLTEDSDKYANNVFIHVEFDSEDALRASWDKLSEGGTINMPLGRQFWGAVYGDLVDKYGVGWGLHHQLPEGAS